MTGIGYGTSVSWYGSSPTDADKLASALNGVTAVGTRRLWCYPSSGHGKGTPREFGNSTFEYVSVYWDGRSVWLDMIGPKVPKDDLGVSSFLNSINVSIRGDIKTLQKML